MDKILIVDDNVQNCDIMEDVITTWGYEVYKAYQGKEAIELARKYKPDIILLDVMLPGINGFEVCNVLKNDQGTSGTPIVMLTVLNEAEDRIRGFKVGADLFMSKPINYEELKIRIESLISWKKRIETMESQENVINLLLGIMKLLDYRLYNNALLVKKYAEKISQSLSLNEDQHNKLIAAAFLSEIGKIAKVSDIEDFQLSLEIISPLKMSSWMDQYINNCQVWSESLPIEEKVLIITKRFVNLLDEEKTKEEAMKILLADSEKGHGDREIIKVLQLVLDDEKFIDKYMS